MKQFIRRAAHRARIGYLAGSFDEFDLRHAAMLRDAHAACDVLVIGVYSDELLTAEGTPPAWPLDRRIGAVRRSRYVADAIPQTETDVRSAWLRTGFDVLFTGGDWRDGHLRLRLERSIAGIQADLVSLPYASDYSASSRNALSRS